MNEPDWMVWVMVIVLFWMAGSVVVWSLRLGITPTPTSRKVLKTIDEVLPEQVEGDIYELGCGWGHLLVRLAQKYPKHRITGYEQSPLPFLVARLISMKYRNVRVIRKDFFSVNLSEAGLVTCYLYRAAMNRLGSHFESEVACDCLIISHTFRLPGWVIRKEVRADDVYRTPVFVYRKQ